MPREIFSVTGKTAVVTGASSGLGERIARLLHARGARVVVGARRLDRLKQLAEELGDKVVPVRCDVRDQADCEQLVLQATKAGGGTVDILVNSAGIGDVGPAEEESPTRFREIVDVNLNAVFALSVLAARQMLTQGSGSIINIASVLGLVASSPIKQAGYCASKGGIINLTRELGAQWASRGVRVNAIAPGWFPSEMTREMFSDKAGMSFITRNTPIGRPGREDELDGVLLFLASSASSYVVGQTIAVDGGWSIR